MTSRRHAHALFYVVPFAFLYLVTMWGIWRTPNILSGMYANTDGMWAAWNLQGIFQWGRFLDPAPFNPLSGMGSTFLPNLPWLNPGALGLGLPLPRDLTYAISYTLYFAELCVAHIVLFRVLGLSPLPSVVGTQLYLLMLFPPWSGVLLALTWYSLAPVNAHLVAVANGILSLFVLVGRYRVRGNLACVAGMVALAVSGLYSAPITFLTYGPAYSLAAVALLIGQRPARPVLLWKLAAVAAIGAILWLCGVPDYLRATAAMSTRADHFPPAFAAGSAMLSIDFWMDLWRRFDVCGRPQELLCRRYPVFWLHVGALAGAAIQLFRRPSGLRPLAAGFLLWVAFIHFWELTAKVTLFGSVQNVLSPPFLTWSAYTFSALFLAVFAFAALDGAGRLVAVARRSLWPEGRYGRWSVGAGLLVMVIPLFALYLWVAKIARHQPPPRSTKHAFRLLGRSSLREPVIGPVTRYLIDHASLTPGAPFRGYTATYFGDPAGHLRRAVGYQQDNMSVHIYIESRQYLDRHYGNRFQETDLWEFNIPTFEEYGQWITRPVYALATALFSAPGDAMYPPFLRVYRLDLDLLRALGVRFLITDVRLDDPRVTLRTVETSRTAGPIHLYEIARPNLGHYSPTRPITVTTFGEAMSTLRGHRERLATDVVVFADLPGSFLPARAAAVRMERGGIRVAAESDGRSLVLLPVQFSRCWQLDPEPSGDRSSIRLLRANGIQTLVEFHGRIDTKMTFRFGLFGTARCRLQDVEDFRALESRP